MPHGFVQRLAENRIVSLSKWRSRKSAEARGTVHAYNSPSLHSAAVMSTEAFDALRQHMIAEIAAQTIYISARLGKAALARDVLEIVGRVPRHQFVPVELQAFAYANTPLPIGFDKTISQPF